MESLDERLQSATSTPAQPPYRLAQRVAEVVEREGRAALVVELARPTPSTTPEQLAEIARAYVRAGADALAVCTDAEDTPEGMRDLWTVARAVGGGGAADEDEAAARRERAAALAAGTLGELANGKPTASSSSASSSSSSAGGSGRRPNAGRPLRPVPVLRRDWIIHPIQIVEAKEAGAAGVLGVVAQVSSRGTGVMSSFAAAIGLDAPVEVVNAREAEALARQGLGFFGINLAVGLQVAVPGFAADVAKGVLSDLPFGSLSLVGARSVGEASKARRAGADAIFVTRQLLVSEGGGGGEGRGGGLSSAEAQAKALSDPARVLAELRYATSGDD
jgi:indole-3-glycerol phosphate synthase